MSVVTSSSSSSSSSTSSSSSSSSTAWLGSSALLTTGEQEDKSGTLWLISTVWDFSAHWESHWYPANIQLHTLPELTRLPTKANPFPRQPTHLSEARISQFCLNSLPDRFTQVWRSSPFPHYLTSQAVLNGRMNLGAHSTECTWNHTVSDLLCVVFFNFWHCCLWFINLPPWTIRYLCYTSLH